jgi:hypothetical protein
MAAVFDLEEPQGVTAAPMKTAFDEQGFVIVQGLLKDFEVAKLISFFETSQEIQKHAYGRDDGQGKVTKVALWNQPGDDIGSMVSRSPRVVYTLRDLLGGHELYHYHTKLMMKEATVMPIIVGTFDRTNARI